MKADTKRRIGLVIDQAIGLAQTGTDPWVAAREALTAQQSDVYRELAVAAIVDTVERRQRAATLRLEQEAQRSRAAMAETAPGAAPASYSRASSNKAYWRWVETTDEGRTYEDEVQRSESAIAADFARAIDATVSQYVTNLRIQWTEELLDTSIALGDGTKVLWGDATPEQHAQRAEMFERNAGANLDGAARHRLAIRELNASGAGTLREMVGTAVAS